MSKKKVFHRGDEIGYEVRKLPSVTYNTLRLLLNCSDSSAIFLPIRSIQYMAIIDPKEVIFIDGSSAKRSIEFAWHHFKPQERDNLIDPVTYRLTYYDTKALETMKRLQWEFDKFLHQQYRRLKEKQSPFEAKIITLNTSVSPTNKK